MSAINPEFVERYQLELEKNPNSRVFAPLAEAYRKMGLLEEAKRICRRGVQAHPEFAGGRVAFAKVLLDLKAHNEALTQLEKAVQISPDNLLAHSLLGETLLQLRHPKEALKAFKMALFLNPSDERALQAVRKWEFLTAEEYDDEVFAMKPLFRPETEKYLPPLEAAKTQRSDPPETQASSPPRPSKEVERVISLADAFTVRNDLHAALEILLKARESLGTWAEIESRIKLLQKRTQALEADDTADDVADDTTNELQQSSATRDSANIQASDAQRRRQVLELWLKRIDRRRLEG